MSEHHDMTEAAERDALRAERDKLAAANYELCTSDFQLRAVLREIVESKKRHLFGVPIDLVDLIQRAEKLLEGGE